ncbi:MAG TPA: hypothetical protein IGS31_04285 [Oscillatoriales cyanobacterium M4454_W2019_049]|nr:hypothetical protein [Oscillatoriales cyanobacterium M4454_W2019_049]
MTPTTLLVLLIIFFLFVVLASVTPLLGYSDKKWILPFMWGLFGVFTLLGWAVFLGIGWLNF